MLNQVELSQIDLNLLVVFDTVMQERHVARAARRLGVTASAVSHGLGRLRALLHDPLFLRVPKGVVPTARGHDLAAPVADVLARVRGVVALGQPFAPASSTRRFVAGGPDAVMSVVLPRVIAGLRQSAPGVTVGTIDLLPMHMVGALDAKQIDLAVMPAVNVPARFAARELYVEDFVAAARIGHPFLAAPTLARYCAQQHVLCSSSGDPHGHIDRALARLGHARRVVLAVPTFMLALAVLAETDLVAALPRWFVATHGARFGVASCALPVDDKPSPICAIAPTVALHDAGLAWLFDLIHAVARVEPPATAGRGRSAPAARRRRARRTG